MTNCVKEVISAVSLHVGRRMVDVAFLFTCLMDFTERLGPVRDFMNVLSCCICVIHVSKRIDPVENEIFKHSLLCDVEVKTCTIHMDHRSLILFSCQTQV